MEESDTLRFAEEETMLSHDLAVCVLLKTELPIIGLEVLLISTSKHY